MDLTSDSQQRIEIVAREALEQLTKIAEAANRCLYEERGPGSESLASVNTMTSAAAVNRLSQISRENLESFQVLVSEPAIARVVVADEEGEEKTFYICRTTPVSGFSNLASYRAPVGRLASLEPGTEFQLPGGKVVEVLERARLRPESSLSGWDSHNTVFEADDFGPITIESLRALLAEFAGEELDEDILEQLLAEENSAANLIEGIRRSVITKMGLRDQPVLDQYQDEIFRLPLDKRMLLLGPPGTGKTTTLIRRLGQKLDIEFLDQHEKSLVDNPGSSAGVIHTNSWLMFTPTELLKQYLKEAFAREDVPASDQRIRTWYDYRRELARSVFGVLKTSSGGGTFVLKDALQNLTPDTLDRPIDWFESFDGWQRSAFIQELQEASQRLFNGPSGDVQALGKRLTDILEQNSSASLVSIFTALAAEVPHVQSLVSSLKEASDAKIKRTLTLHANRNKSFLDELSRYIGGLQQSQPLDADEQDELDADDQDEDEASTPKAGRAAAMAAYMKAVRAQVRASASKRSLSKNSRNGQILDWLGDRTLSEADRAEVGASLLVQASARRFVSPVKRYLDGIPKRYRSFRRQHQEQGPWYTMGGFEHRELSPLELDVVLLTILRGAGSLLSNTSILRNIDSPAWSPLKPTLGLYRNQILVDEATDFSPIQLACMAAVAHPRLRSFFACGDFNQRLTTWGARSTVDLEWVFPDIEIKEITVSYRQTRQLNELARDIIRTVGGTEQAVSLPEHVDSEGVAPVLLEDVTDQISVVTWLADRICEIERFVGQLPSTAIFVNSEDQVAPLAKELNAALSEHNIQVVACPQGQVMGQDNDVRVFDIQHIKGLEFEAVFFIGVDCLATLHPKLFEKYLYVGTTRAATYLGITCEVGLPESIETLRDRFVSDWCAQ